LQFSTILVMRKRGEGKARGPAAKKVSPLNRGKEVKKWPPRATVPSKPAAPPAVIVHTGDMFWHSTYMFSWFFGAVVEILEIKADPTEQISVRTLFCEVDGKPGKWEKHTQRTWMRRSEFYNKYVSEHKLDLVTLNCNDKFPGLWQQVEPDKLSFVPGWSGVADPEVV
jgi:hypothetical protein